MNNLIFKKISEKLYNEEVEILNSDKELRNCIIECNFDYYYDINLNEKTFNFYEIIYNRPAQKIIKSNSTLSYINSNKNRSSVYLKLKFSSKLKDITYNWRDYEKSWKLQ